VHAANALKERANNTLNPNVSDKWRGNPGKVCVTATKIPDGDFVRYGPALELKTTRVFSYSSLFMLSISKLFY
jgi:hypothetical protein